MHKDFYKGMRIALPVCLGIFPVGLSFGLLSVQAGLSLFQTVLMSVTVVAGSAQLIVIGMIGQGAAVGTMVLATFFINLRHIVMSSAVMSRLRSLHLGKKLVGAYLICDESFALFSMSEEQSYPLLRGAETVLYSTWIVSTVLGSIVNSFLPEIVINSFGIAFYASFIAMLLPELKGKLRLAVLVLSTALLNWLLQSFLPASWAVIIAMVAGAAAGTFFIEDKEAAK